jgi:hypothetical protein
MRQISLAIAVIVVLLPTFCWGWGPESHHIIATVAEDHLDETTKVMIQSLIGENHLYSIASWADEVVQKRPETKTWHYVHIPLGSEYNAARDCPAPNSCVVAKINEFVKVLTDKKATHDRRGEALKFLVNLTAEVHQPMHVVKEAEGGSKIHVRLTTSVYPGPGSFGSRSVETTLRGLWNTFPLLQLGMPQYATFEQQSHYTAHLEQLIKQGQLDKEAGGAPEQWANESLRLAQAAWVADGAQLDANYYDQQIKVVDRQMALAGLRLARLLNDTIGKMTPRDFD